MTSRLNNRRKKVEKAEEEVKSSKKDMPSLDAALPMMLDLPPLRMLSLYGDLDEKKAHEIVMDLFAYHDMKVTVDQQIKETSDKVKKQLLGNLGHKDPVKFLVSTFGGNAVDMFGIHDAMCMLQEAGVEIHTVGSGKVMSAGVLLLASGTKGKRTIGKNCRVMVHPVVGGAHGPSHDIQNEVEEILQTQKQYVECLAKSTKLSVSRLNKLISEKRNIYLSAAEAVKFGIADKII